MTDMLARLFNRMLTDGCVPDTPSFRDGNLTPLFKGKGGDRNDPAAYRGITVPSLMGKLLGVIITARITHWATHNNIISPSQVGFRAWHGADHHILTLTETLASRAAAGLDTAVLFADISKAYDTVPHDALFWLLERMGIAPALVTFLRRWYDGTRITLSMDGVTAAPFVQQRGLAQGAPTSPILFSLFLQPLLNRLDASARDDDGVTVTDGKETVRLRTLAYADDVAYIGGTEAALHRAGATIAAWCATVGMQLGIGAGKTEAMYVSGSAVKAAKKERARAKRHTPAAAPTAATAGTHNNGGTAAAPPVVRAPIPLGTAGAAEWTTWYRYLGYRVYNTLYDNTVCTRIIAATTRLVRAMIPFNRTIAALPVPTQRSLLLSAFSGSMLYHLPFLPPTQRTAVQRQGDTVLGAAARAVLRMRPKDPNIIHEMVLALPTTAALTDAARLRMWWSLRPDTHPLGAAPAAPLVAQQPLAVRLTRTLLFTPGFGKLWTGAAHKLALAALELPGVGAIPQQPWRVAASAHVAARALAQDKWWAHVDRERVRLGIDNVTAYSAPPSHRPIAFTMAVLGVGAPHELWPHHPLSRAPAHLTALSARGPMATPLPAGLSNVEPGKARVVTAALNGHATLYRPPFYMPPTWQTAADDAAAAVAEPNPLDGADPTAPPPPPTRGTRSGGAAPRGKQGKPRGPAEFYRLQAKAPCPLCNVAGTSIWHALFDCTNEEVAAVARGIHDATPTLLLRLVEEAESAAARYDTETESAPWLPSRHNMAAVTNAATAARDIISTLTSAPGGWPAHDIHAQWATLLAVLAFPHTARGLRTPPPSEKPDAPPVPTTEPATITLALLRAMGHLWDTLMVDDRYLRQLANHWIITAARNITNLGNVWKQEVQRVAPPDTAAAGTGDDGDNDGGGADDDSSSDGTDGETA